jgi:TatD DNase family protein
LPLIVHCRNAWDDTFGLLKASGEKLKTKGVFHSWTGGLVEMKQTLALGFYISFSGIVTFKNAPDVQEVARKMPLERMLVETDSPFLSPEPLRGSRNEPKNVRITAQFLAALRNLPLDRIEEATTKNAADLFFND